MSGNLSLVQKSGNAFELPFWTRSPLYMLEPEKKFLHLNTRRRPTTSLNCRTLGCVGRESNNPISALHQILGTALSRSLACISRSIRTTLLNIRLIQHRIPALQPMHVVVEKLIYTRSGIGNASPDSRL